MEKISTIRLIPLLLILFLASTASVYSQPYTVTGSLYTENVNLNPSAEFTINEPLSGIEVKLFNGAIELDTDITNNNGAYSLTHSEADGTLRIVTTATSALQSREITGIPTGITHDEGASTVFWVEGSVLYNGVRYRTVTIGDQVWMAENLRTNKYRNGEAIPNVTDNTEWSNLSTGAWSIYDNPVDGENHVLNFNRGKLYNWYAVNDARGLCPVGWDVASDDNIKVLEAELGMLAADLDVLGGAWRGEAQEVSNKLRSTGGADDFFWRLDNTEAPIATNSSGFSMRGTSLRFAGGGFGAGGGDFSSLGEVAQIWSSTENNANTAIRRIIRSNQAGVRRNAAAKELGLAVRCVKTQADTASNLDFSETGGVAGWRMMSVPFAGVVVSDLADQNQISGISGANNFYNVENMEGDGATANFMLFNPAEYDSGNDDPTGWVAPQNFDTELPLGTGFIWYFFDNDNGPSKPLNDFTLSFTGVTPDFDIAVDITADNWNLIGNPFASNIDANQLSGAGLHSAAGQIWNSADETFEAVEFTTGNTISTWQAFFVESDTADEFTIPESARTESDATFFSVENEMRLSFTLTGEDEESGRITTDRAIQLVMDDNASLQWDRRDIRKIDPLSAQNATMAFVGTRGDQEIFKAQESIPVNFGGALDLTMTLKLSNMSGAFTLDWEGISTLPSVNYASLTDHVTGTVVYLNEVSSYQFEARNDDEENIDRFTLTLSETPLSTEPLSDLPSAMQLDQNYPNPFNPTTQISFAVPQESFVRLSVHDLLGREIAVLVNESHAPGNYQANWNASGFASGVYFYRLEASGNILTRRMTLVK